MYTTDPKNGAIRAFINGMKADIFGMSEMGLCWHLLPTKDRIWERTRGWFETLKTTVAYNRHEPNPNAVQWGGTSLWSINHAAHRATESGTDSWGLGHWVWTRYRGRGNVTLRVVSTYCPCDSFGPLTVYAQHQNFFDESDLDGCPRELFTTHLMAAITQWSDAGNQILLLVDANEDIRTFATTIQSTGLREVVLERHGSNAPATYNGGSTPIDGIFAPPSINIILGG
jgi:hypothetical protein